MFKLSHLLLFLSVLFYCDYNCAQSLDFAIGIGGNGHEWVNDMEIDSDSNMYIVGTFMETVDFDPSSATYELTSMGNKDGFIAKYNKNGELIWVDHIKNGGGLPIHGVAIDSSGNVYATGSFQYTTFFDPFNAYPTVVNSNVMNIFMTKYSPNGEFLWVKALESPYNEYATDIEVDAESNLYITGRGSSAIDFDPGPNTYYANYTGGNLTSFLAKYTTHGDLIWAFNVSGANNCSARQIAIDQAANIYMIGEYTGLTDFDPGPDTVMLNTNVTSDIYVAKYDSSSHFQWAFNLGGGTSSYTTAQGADIAYHSSGKIAVCGVVFGSVDFDPGSNVYQIGNTSGQADAFVAVYSDDAQFEWARTMGGTSHSLAHALTFDHQSNVLLTGYFHDSLNFNQNGTPSILVAKGTGDNFYQKISAQGDHEWVFSMSGLDNAYSPVVKVIGNSLVTGGSFLKNVSCNPQSPTDSLYNYSGNALGFSDLFFSRYDLTSSTIGLVEEEPFQHILIYPQPATDNLFIHCSDLNGEPFSIQVNGLHGTHIESFNGIFSDKISLRVSDYPSGVYFYTLTSSGVSKSGRFVVY